MPRVRRILNGILKRLADALPVRRRRCIVSVGRYRYPRYMPASDCSVRHVAAVATGTVFCMALGVYYLATMDDTPFWGDESGWIGKSEGWFLLIHGEFDAPFWDTEGLDQPMFAPYAFGIVATLSGYTKATLNKMYDFEKDFAQNQREGRVPDPTLLRRCRALSIVCAILGCGAAMVIVWRLTGPVGGLITGILLGLNPHYIRWAQRAMSDGMLSLWLLLAWMICAVLANALQRRDLRRAWKWSLILGVVAGFGMMTKLTAAVIPLGIVGMGLVQVYLAERKTSAPRPVGRWRAPAMASVVASATGCGIFVLQSPTTWRNPPNGIHRMMEWRKTVIQKQQQVLPEYVVHGTVGRIRMLEGRVWRDLGTFAAWGLSKRIHIAWFDGWLFLTGLVWLLLRQRRARIAQDASTWQEVVLAWIWTLVLILPCGLLLPYDHDRYYLTALLASTLIQAAVLGAICRSTGRVLLRMSRLRWVRQDVRPSSPSVEG